MVLYFSGTGNSRYVAKVIAEILDDQVQDIVRYTKSSSLESFTISSRRPFVFVAPVYVAAPARIMMDFIDTTIFDGRKDCYFVLTCGAKGNGQHAIGNYCKKLCKDNALDYKGYAVVHMPESYTALFNVAERKDCQSVIDEAEKSAREIARKIKEGEQLNVRSLTRIGFYGTDVIYKLYYKYNMGTKKFTVNDSCKGCGKCQRLCPYSNISIVEGKPVWGKVCTHCMSCINLCPTKAINYGKKTEKRNRYYLEDYAPKERDESSST